MGMITPLFSEITIRLSQCMWFTIHQR